MIYRLRIILDSEEDVVRDLEIKSDSSFEDLHFAIINSFNFNGNEMASFYLSDDNWSQGEEITLESFGDEKVMKFTSLNSIIKDSQLNFIYVYDFLKLWTFFVEVVEICEKINPLFTPKLFFQLERFQKVHQIRCLLKIKQKVMIQMVMMRKIYIITIS